MKKGDRNTGEISHTLTQRQLQVVTAREKTRGRDRHLHTKNQKRHGDKTRQLHNNAASRLGIQRLGVGGSLKQRDKPYPGSDGISATRLRSSIMRRLQAKETAAAAAATATQPGTGAQSDMQSVVAAAR